MNFDTAHGQLDVVEPGAAAPSQRGRLPTACKDVSYTKAWTQQALQAVTTALREKSIPVAPTTDSTGQIQSLHFGADTAGGLLAVYQ